ncbi:glycosyltransferase family 2 protein [Luminiphilus sp.]|nr:glycosyltransferase family 2 protein [Luminiphilus sp.]MDB2313491.1 glycosyltransferase family 2 protein [Luminiphilus sp.]
MKAILSIVVPTKNRYYYLKFLVKYFNSINSDQIELIVHDNSDLGENKDFVNFLDCINDSRVRYYYLEESVSQPENCDYAVSKASGEYVTMLGDDDIFSKYLIEHVLQWSNNEIDAILPIKGSFIWPDVKPRLYKDTLSGVFRTSNITGDVNYINPLILPDMVMKTGGTQILNLPCVYHGIVRKDILDKVYQDSGSYFPGPSPDMANAMALCKYVKKYISIDIPLIISGQGSLSAGGKGSIGEHFGEISKVAQLPKDTSANWTKGVPFYWSGNTIYSESVIQSLKRMGMAEVLSTFNYEYLYATCLVFDRKYKTHIKIAIATKKKNKGLKIYKIRYYFIKLWCERISHHLKNNLALLLPWISKKDSIFIKKTDTFEVAKFNDNYIKKLKLNNPKTPFNPFKKT